MQASRMIEASRSTSSRPSAWCSCRSRAGREAASRRAGVCRFDWSRRFKTRCGSNRF